MRTKTPLLKKVTQNQLIFGGIIVLLSLIILYFLTRQYIESETQESLNNTTHRIELLLTNDKIVTSLSPLFEIKETTQIRPQFTKDTLIFDELQNEYELFRELNTFKAINDKSYHIVVRELLVEYDDTLITILISFAIIISLVTLSQFFYGKHVNKMIWKPFFHNLETIKTFTIHSNKSIELVPSDVLEFSELNTEVESLTKKVLTDYQNLKQFTEDISHEVQTPLSIIQAKIENLLNDSNDLNINLVNVLNDIQKNTTRLSKLNKGLILLTKIENQQFYALEIIDVNIIVHSLLENFEDISNIKNLNIIYKEHARTQLQMDKILADVLFSNLIGNAIKHTENDSTIEISIDSNMFSIKNSGQQSIVNSEHIFDRFYKENPRSHSLGLGLAIVNKICNYYNFTIDYNFNNDMHQFDINFKSTS
jgi:hypothetical protein